MEGRTIAGGDVVDRARARHGLGPLPYAVVQGVVAHLRCKVNFSNVFAALLELYREYDYLTDLWICKAVSLSFNVQ